MKLNNISGFCLFSLIYFFIPLFFISAERLETFLIVPPEYSDDSVSTYSPSDKKLLLENIQDEIYRVFKHYSSGNAEKGSDFRVSRYKKIPYCKVC